MLTLKMNGSSGLSGLDAGAWNKMCTSFQSSSADLWYALISLTIRMCISYNPAGIYPLLANRLIAIDKHPGVRPIGVCEVVHCIIGKAAFQVVGHDVVEVAGCEQLCAGQPRGCEAVVHSI